VLHTGDTYFKGRYPYIDLDSGGSVDGYIKAVKLGLQLIDDDTKVIPGHGNLSNKEEYQSFLKMLEDLKSKISEAIKTGKTEDEIAKDATLTKTYDDLDYGTGFINSEKIRRTFYLSLKNYTNSSPISPNLFTNRIIQFYHFNKKISIITVVAFILVCKSLTFF
jgi:hypothetical protein